VERRTAEPIVLDAGDLPECPRWDDVSQRLHWVDIYAGRLCVWSPSTGERSTYDVGQPLGSFAFREGQGFVLALAAGFALSGADPSGWEPVGAHRLPDSPIRMNDGACDPVGRFLAGTMRHDEAAHGGALWRLDPQTESGQRPPPEPVVAPTSISNGLGWSADGRTLFHVDSADRVVWVRDYDVETGTVAASRPFVTFDEGDGYPDGLVVDSEGCLWVALWDGGRVVRVDPTGEVLAEVLVPARRVSSCTLGGVSGSELYITTARRRLDPSVLEAEPLHGSIFVCPVDVTAPTLARYAG